MYNNLSFQNKNEFHELQFIIHRIKLLLFLFCEHVNNLKIEKEKKKKTVKCL